MKRDIIHLEFDLIKRGYRCTGQEIFEGYTSSANLCAASCKIRFVNHEPDKPYSPIFMYGNCNGFGCRCYCQLNNKSGSCVKDVENAIYDLYSLKLGKDVCIIILYSVLVW